ncbi:hypothetical protein HQ496_06945 [bacterium]|nr:hypothetical protein [bacterium]
MSAFLNFTDQDRERIAKAVKTAESATSGEIVPVIVSASGQYPEGHFKAMLAGMAVGLVLFEGYLLLFAGWSIGFWSGIVGIPLFVSLGGALGMIASVTIPRVQRLFISNTRMDTEVHSRALKAFVDHEVFLTRDRTGIVLLVSMFERRVEVFGDSAINKAVESDDWSEVIALVIRAVKSGKTVDGLTEGILHCGKLLERLGLEIRPDDTNELSNLPRIE